MLGLYVADGTIRLRADLPAPALAAGECRVRVLRAGVCATDLALVRGYMGFTGTPGHEFVGVALDGPLAGRRVVGEINAGCGACAACRAGLERHCPARTVLGILGRPGAFAETLRLPGRNLHAVPDTVATDAAVFTEPLAAAFEIAEQVALAPGARALVVGDGRLGLLCAHVLALAGLAVTVAGRHPERAALLPSGAAHATGLVEPGAAAPAERYDLVVEATGDPAVLQRVLGLVRPRGTIVLKTTSERPAPLDLAPAVVDEITIVGSRCGRFSGALAALAAGQVPVAGLIHDRFPLAEGVRALGRAAEPGVLKVVLDVGGEEP
jgi:threonine dehydrogenase-like Zn-dependent dehydrogenase